MSFLEWDHIPPHIKALHWAEAKPGTHTAIQKAMVKGFLQQHIEQRAQNKDPTNVSTIRSDAPQPYTPSRGL